MQCPKGHFYDSSLPSCPYCLPSKGSVGTTTPVNQYGGNVGATTPVNQYGGDIGSTPPVNPHQVQQETKFIGDLSDPNNPKPIQPTTPTRVRPVVGWLVCVQGPDIGKDFRLHTHFNHVGRAENQDVRLNDESVSREHFTVAYDMVHNRYFADMGKGSTFVYINGYPLGARVTLKKGDQIKLANTLLVFIPLEQQDVKWNWKI